MAEPFIIFTLPRSRSKWLSVFLDVTEEERVGHDTLVDCQSLEEFLLPLAQGKLLGTCETGAMVGWRVIRHLLPLARFAVVRRHPDEVIANFASLGLRVDRNEIYCKADMLDALSSSPGVLTLQFEQLEDPNHVAKLFEFTTGRPFDLPRYERLNSIDIQIDMSHRIGRLMMNSERLAKLAREIDMLSQNLTRSSSSGLQ